MQASRSVWVFVLTLLFPLSTAARPSLVDLDGDLQQVVDGLCHGDPALCGQPAPASVAGQLDFDSGTFVLDFTSLHFGYAKPVGGAFAFDDLTATVDSAGLSAILAGELASSTVYDVEVIVPDPSGPGNVTLLALQNATLEELTLDASGTSAQLRVAFTIAQLSWMGSSSSWNEGLGSGSGCTAPGGDKHVSLAGNPASLLGPGEIDVFYSVFLSGSGLGFEWSRAPIASSACYLRTVASGTSIPQDFHRLSPLSETFASQLRDESIDFSVAVVESWGLTIEGGEMRERVVYGSTTGTLTSRSFSPVDGSLTSQFSQGL
jgi:hypothetical protein